MQSRALHKRKELSYPIEEGLGTFLSPDALKIIAVDYQQGLLDRLNDQVRGARDLYLEGVVTECAEHPAGIRQARRWSTSL